jgi:meso-butanediol dehydrogenase / (S,S)-butanediol dehydrogenase / diacetyl reductase
MCACVCVCVYLRGLHVDGRTRHLLTISCRCPMLVHIIMFLHSAAAFVFGKVTDVTNDQWDTVLSVNVKGYAITAKYAIKAMVKSQCTNGSIVNIASTSSFVAQPAFVPYNTTKGAILQLSRCMALDHGPQGIRSNCVCPGTIDTPATSKHADSLGISKEELSKQIIDTHFVKRLGSTIDVANAVLFLASDESSFITGAALSVDGGYIAQ